MAENTSLKEQLLSLARATGADIKALNKRITDALANTTTDNEMSAIEVQRIVSE